jgi:hypothetical protein
MIQEEFEDTKGIIRIHKYKKNVDILTTSGGDHDFYTGLRSTPTSVGYHDFYTGLRSTPTKNLQIYVSFSCYEDTDRKFLLNLNKITVKDNDYY